MAHTEFEGEAWSVVQALGPFGNPKCGPDLPCPGSLLSEHAPRGDWFKDEAQRQAFARIRSNYDEALQVAEVRPLCPQVDQDTKAYRRMLLESLAPHSSRLEQARLQHTGPSSFDRVEETLLAAVMAKPKLEGRLAEIQHANRAGAIISEFVGDKNAWMSHFRGGLAGEGLYIGGKRAVIPASPVV